MDKDPSGYFSKLKAAAYADVSPRTLDNAVERGELVAFKLTIKGARPRKVLFRRSDIDSWIEQFRVSVCLDLPPTPLATGEETK